MLSKKLILFFIFLLGSIYCFSQNNMLDSTKIDKVGNKKNAFYFEALGSSSLAGVYYERFIPIKIKDKRPIQIRIQGGFSPFTFFRFSFSDGISLPVGVNFIFLPGRFKIGVGMMFLNSLYFAPIDVEDRGYTPVKITQTQYKLFLQPQVILEYHLSQKFLGKITFNPTFMPGLHNGKTTYTFMPWGGISFGYKF